MRTCFGIGEANDPQFTLSAAHEHGVCYAAKTKQVDMRTSEETAHPLDSNDDKEPQAVCYAIDQQGGKSNCWYAENIMVTLCSDSHGTPNAVCYGREDGENRMAEPVGLPDETHCRH